MKCDETKPSCQRCVKFGWNCEGYRSDTDIYIPQASKAESRKLVPQSCPTPSLSAGIRLGPIFTDEWQSRYFRYYCEEIAGQIRGPNKTSLWERIVPQAGEAEPFIVHAIVALSALSKSQTTHWIRGPSQHTLLMDSHQQYALVQYGQALQGMRLAIQNQVKDRRKALVACLLVFCFECLLGRQAAASSYASSGVSLLYSCHADQLSPSSLVEDDLYSAFSGLDLQSLIHVNIRTLATHQNLKDDINVVLRLMPDVFKNLKECRTFWQLIMRRNLHFLATARAVVQAWDSSAEDTTTSDSLYLKNKNNPCAVAFTKPENIPPKLLGERDQCLADIRRWQLASAPLFSQSVIETEDRIATMLLKINAALTTIMISQTSHQIHPPELVYDNYVPEFTTIVKLCSLVKEILSDRDCSFHCATFRFDIGVIPALAATGSNCRDREVRGQAIDLLLASSGYREGIWDAVAAGTICNWQRSIEEEFIDERGHIPGNRRSTVSGLELSLQKRKADVAFKQWVGDGPEDFVIRETVLRW